MIDVGKQLADNKHRPAVREDLCGPCDWAILCVMVHELSLTEATYRFSS
jgi:hypothetical protein